MVGTTQRQVEEVVRQYIARDLHGISCTGAPSFDLPAICFTSSIGMLV